MAWILVALAPAMLVLVVENGVGWLARPVFAISVALAVEAAASALRGAPLRRWLTDASAALTGLLVLLCLPAGASLASLALGVVIALALGKHAFGGLGENPFNPAMLGVAAGLLAFPGATAPAAPSAWLPLAYLAGGCVLLARGVVAWQAPLGVLLGTAVAAAIAAARAGSSIGAMPTGVAQALAASPVLLGAFFVATDPVSGCAHRRARIFFGLGVGALMFVIDRGRPGLGLPSAILLMNFLAPWLDRVAAPAPTAAVR
jgi:electron transport complex protein RnfD